MVYTRRVLSRSCMKSLDETGCRELIELDESFARSFRAVSSKMREFKPFYWIRVDGHECVECAWRGEDGWLLKEWRRSMDR